MKSSVLFGFCKPEKPPNDFVLTLPRMSQDTASTDFLWKLFYAFENSIYWYLILYKCSLIEKILFIY